MTLDGRELELITPMYRNDRPIAGRQMSL